MCKVLRAQLFEQVEECSTSLGSDRKGWHRWIEGWDWDNDIQGWLIGAPITIGSANTSGIDGDAADASKNFNVAGNGHDQAFTQNFSFETTNQSLKFRAFGSIQVFYAP